MGRVFCDHRARGQKALVHIHGVFRYFFVPFDGERTDRSSLRELAEELEAEFAKAGNICSTKLKPYERDGMDGSKFQSSQIAYVLYEDVKSAQKCIRMFDNSRPFGLGHRALKVDFWQAKEDLKKEKDEKSQN